MEAAGLDQPSSRKTHTAMALLLFVVVALSPPGTWHLLSVPFAKHLHAVDGGSILFLDNPILKKLVLPVLRGVSDNVLGILDYIAANQEQLKKSQEGLAVLDAAEDVAVAYQMCREEAEELYQAEELEEAHRIEWCELGDWAEELEGSGAASEEPQLQGAAEESWAAKETSQPYTYQGKLTQQHTLKTTFFRTLYCAACCTS